MKNHLVEALNRQLASWNVLYTKLHNYHWNVTGADFFTLHLKFEEYYTEVATTIDQIAERILTINGRPLGTLKDYLEVSVVTEAVGTEQAKDMVATIASDFELLIEEANFVIEIAERENDESTGDMFIQIKTTLEQHTWMLKAYLG
ncbi:Dps family protein [Bacillus alkalicellulosilyticus]|uniref:Dps family protein n=1 Tax=Alkalihalobacterium alkalicellulosilyticum TaxID=1912214 RepID=UPI0009966915|nr:DNA starvation/stationary phase protection protein [Bacillus alkalicellulosilyticus]